MAMIQLNALRLNAVDANIIALDGVRRRGSHAGAPPVVPPEEPDTPVEPTTYTLVAEVTNGVVSAKLNGSAVQLPYTATEGDVIVLEVTPAEGYEFTSWADGNAENPRTITMVSNVTLSASCEVATPSNPDVDENGYIIFEDAEVARICAETWGDGTGITLEQAAAVTSLSTVFEDNSQITSFNELKYFKNVTSLERAFPNTTSLREIALDNITTIGGQASNGSFYRSGLKRAIFTKLSQISTTTGVSDFFESAVELLILEGTLSSIGYGGSGYGFARGAKLLYCVLLPYTMTDIGGRSFQECSSLTSLICKAATPPTITTNTLISTPIASGTGSIYVPDASVEAYKTATNWSSYASRILPVSQLATDNPELYAEIEEYL